MGADGKLQITNGKLQEAGYKMRAMCICRECKKLNRRGRGDAQSFKNSGLRLH